MTFEDDIRGRTVAVVGPAPPVGDQSAEIEAHDLVARIAWFGDNPPEYGSRCDLVYYNGYWGREVQHGRPVPDVTWLCFKSQVRLLRPNWRQAKAPGDLRRPNMVPLAVNDLLAAGAAQVAVYGANFYLGSDPYYDAGYIPEKFRPAGTLDDVMRSTFRLHDQILQRSWLRRPLATGALTGDARFLDAINLDDGEYRRRVHSTWGVEASTLTEFINLRTGDRRAVKGTALRNLERNPRWERADLVEPCPGGCGGYRRIANRR